MTAPAVVAAPAEPVMSQPAAILADTRRVADWQLANRTNGTTMPAARKSVREVRDWQQATFWVALTELANRDTAYAKPLLDLGRAEQRRMGDLPFHADDQLIGQAWLWAAQNGAGKNAIAPMRAYFDHALAHRPTNGPAFHPVTPED